jgi:hypothetical protein
MMVVFALIFAMLLFPVAVRVMDICGMTRCGPFAHLTHYKVDALSVFAGAAPWLLLAGLALTVYRGRAAISKDLGSEQRALQAQLIQPQTWASFAFVLLFLAAVQQEAQTPTETSFWVGLLLLPVTILLIGVPAAFERRREMKWQFYLLLGGTLLAAVASAPMAGNLKEAAEIFLLPVIPVGGIFAFPFAFRRVFGDAAWNKWRVAVGVTVALAILLLVGVVAMTLLSGLGGG